MAAGSGGAVFLALLGNGLLTVIKFIAFLLSNSPAMLSEAVHSLADTANQALLFVGIRRSERPADSRYHWGYGGERFLFALLSAIGIFVLGCGVTVYHGVHSLFDPPALSFSWVTYLVLAVALVVDGFVFVTALREVATKKGDQSLWHFIKTSSDPTLLAVLFEDFVASVGVLIAMAGIGLAQITGNVYFDAASSIIIGLMLGFIAIWLGFRNRELILGPSIPKDLEAEVLAFLRDQPSIENVRRVRTRIVASDKFAFAAEVDYDGAYLGKQHSTWVAEKIAGFMAGERGDADEFAGEFGERLLDALSAEVDRLEAELRKRFPRLVFVDLESDDCEATSSQKKIHPR